MHVYFKMKDGLNLIVEAEVHQVTYDVFKALFPKKDYRNFPATFTDLVDLAYFATMNMEVLRGIRKEEFIEQVTDIKVIK